MFPRKLALCLMLTFFSFSAVSASVEDYEKQYRNLPCEGVKSKYRDIKKRKKTASGTHKKELNKQLAALGVLKREKC